MRYAIGLESPDSYPGVYEWRSVLVAVYISRYCSVDICRYYRH